MAVPVSETPTVSVLICTKGRRADVARALTSLRADGVDREGVEIVVVEGGGHNAHRDTPDAFAALVLHGLALAHARP